VQAFDLAAQRGELPARGFDHQHDFPRLLDFPFPAINRMNGHAKNVDAGRSAAGDDGTGNARGFAARATGDQDDDITIFGRFRHCLALDFAFTLPWRRYKSRFKIQSRGGFYKGGRFWRGED